MKKPKVFLAWTLNSGTSFYRMFNFIRGAMKDIDFGHSKWTPNFQEIAEWEFKMDDPNVTKDLAFLIDECDMVIAQKFHWYGGLTLMDVLRKQHPTKPFITEIDDNVFAIDKHQQASEAYAPGTEAEAIVKRQIENSTGLIVSTENLKLVMEEHNPNVWVVPNAIDFEIWDKLKESKRTNKRIRIGWAGGGAHIKDLEMIVPIVKNILSKHKNVEFCFLGGVIPELKDLERVEANYKWYPIDKYPQALKDMNLDIALAPLKDSLFNRAKSNLRWLEYSALKIPTIASDVEPFRCINDCKDGIIVSPEQFEEAIETLIKHPTMRKDIGQNAYNRVKKEFSAEKMSKLYVKTIKAILKGNLNISDRGRVAFMQKTGIGL